MADELRSSGKSLFDFGPLAPVYDDWYSTPEGLAHDIVQKRDVCSLLPPAGDSQQLLDVGCGTGHWSRFFSSMGYDVQGIDISEEMIGAAQLNTGACGFDVGNACDLPFPDASFDITTSITALEFIPDQAAAVNEMARCTKPGGTMLIGTLNRIATMNMDRLEKGEEPFASGILHGPDELLELLLPLGEIRMAASKVDDQVLDPVVVAAHSQPVPPEHLAGPLLVARVRTHSL